MRPCETSEVSQTSEVFAFDHGLPGVRLKSNSAVRFEGPDAPQPFCASTRKV